MDFLVFVQQVPSTYSALELLTIAFLSLHNRARRGMRDQVKETRLGDQSPLATCQRPVWETSRLPRVIPPLLQQSPHKLYLLCSQAG